MSHALPRLRFTLATSGLFALALIAGPGCDPPPTVNVVKGSVKVDGKPVMYGSIEFHSATATRICKSVILPDGTYSMTNPELGEMKVVVKAGEIPRGAAAGGGGKPPPKLEKANVPEKYQKLETTDYVITIEPGATTQNIDLKP